MDKNNSDALKGGRGSKPIIGFFVIAVAVTVLIIGFMVLNEKERPQIALLDDVSNFGASREVGFQVTDEKSGIQEISLQIIQDEKSVVLYEKTFPRQSYFLNAGANRIEESIAVDVRSLGFKDGTAELRVSAKDFSWSNWMAGNESTMNYTVSIDTKPPKITVIDSPRYIMTGGSGVVIYKIDEPPAEQGVTVNNHFHPGFPVDESSKDVFLAYIGLPYDTDKFETPPQITAFDRAGNQGRATFTMIVKKKAFRKDQITVSDDFLSQKLPEFEQNYPELTGSPVEQYLYLNSKIREANNRTISQACSSPSPVKLWEGRFMRMARSSRRAGFADQRSYYYSGKQIDEQVHLGIDLASTRHAKVEAANRGRVVFADYLGIYGNTVILDHGQGLFSLYSHLGQIDVALEDIVDQNTVIGLSGSTGMAGGDHLHFSMLINGIFVNPLEWWDAQWIKFNITELLPAEAEPN